MSTGTQEIRNVVSHLNRICFTDIWNEIPSEYVGNIQLTPVGDRYLSGYLSIGSTTIKLPTTDAFSVYTTTHSIFNGGLSISSDGWKNTEDMINTSNINITIYDNKGKTIPHKYVYILRVKNTNKVIIAVNKKPFFTIFGARKTAEIYSTMYNDSDLENTVSCISTFINPTNITHYRNIANAMIQTSIAKTQHGTILYINGFEVDHTKTILLNGGDYVEVISDKNISQSFTTQISHSTGYYSETSQRYREIIHCPKELNADNRIITHNTCSFHARSSKENIGLYIQRNDPISIGQLTHNDMYIDTSILESKMDYLDDQEISVHVRVRVHDKDNVLMDESSYIRYLYTCSDDEIVSHLKGSHLSNIPFWRASELEKSIYTGFMSDSPNEYTREEFEKYIDGLGYYTVCSLLAKHTQQVEHSKFFTVEKPYVYLGINVKPLVYVDGLKIRDDYIQYYNHTESKVIVSISNEIYIDPEKQITVCLVPEETNNLYKITPSADEPTITVPYIDATIYQVTDSEVSGFTKNTNIAFKKRSQVFGSIVVNDNGNNTLTIVFGPSEYGRTFVIQNKSFTYTFLRNMDSDIEVGEALIYDISTRTKNDVDLIVPILDPQSTEVYINGRKLTPTLDYTFIEATDAEGNIGITEVVISNVEYISSLLSGNILEVITHANRAIKYESGFSIDKLISNDKTINIVYSGLSRVFISGRLITNYENNGNYITTEAKNGSPYELISSIPGTLRGLLSEYDAGSDEEKIIAINKYYNLRTPSIGTGPIIIENSHSLYSPYLHIIITDICNGDLDVSDDPDRQRFLKQFDLPKYKYVKDRDRSLTALKDAAYVDINPSYAQFTTTIDKKKICHRLIGYVIGKDIHTLGDLWR
jgi:hypothetical protein